MVGILALTLFGLSFLGAAGHMAYRYRKKSLTPFSPEKTCRRDLVEIVATAIIGAIILAIAFTVAVLAG